jgi:hypothetical protein
VGYVNESSFQLQVWRLPAPLVLLRMGEEKLLQRLLEADDVAGFLHRQAIVRST